MRQQKILFIDRDGTLIEEPQDKQVDSLEKFRLFPGVIAALTRLQQAGYVFVMVSNQDGRGSKSFPEKDFLLPQNLLVNILESQGISFEAIRICPHRSEDDCACRKPKLGLVMDYLLEQRIDREYSYVIGDRHSDLLFAKNLGLQGLQLGQAGLASWAAVCEAILKQSRRASITRKTTETEIKVTVNLDEQEPLKVDTGLPFFNHMLEQLAKQGGFSLSLVARGDLEVDDHHSVEDSAITLGETLRKALGDKGGLSRYGFVLPMDEALAQVALDLSGRSFFSFKGRFERERVGDFSTELVPHFFRSFAEGLKASLHIEVNGENTHHMIEAIFKAVGRSLRQATEKNFSGLASTKGVL